MIQNLLFVFFIGFAVADYRSDITDRWTQVNTVMMNIAQNPDDVDAIAREMVALRSRKQELMDEFKNCQDDSCSYWAQHALVRNRRERRYLKKLANCAAITDDGARQTCSDEVMTRFRRETEPGSKGRLARYQDQWVDARKHLKALAVMLERIGKGRALAIGIDAELQRLSRHNDTLTLKMGACEDNEDCVSGVKGEQKQLWRLMHFVRSMGRCANRLSADDRKNCAARVLRRMKSRTEPASLLNAMREGPRRGDRKGSRSRRRKSRRRRRKVMTTGERRRRRQERRQLTELHRNARRCGEDDADCTRRFHGLLVTAIQKIRRRRRRWRKARLRIMRKERRRRRARRERDARRRKARRRARQQTETSAKQRAGLIQKALTEGEQAPIGSDKTGATKCDQDALLNQLAQCEDEDCHQRVQRALDRCERRKCRRSELRKLLKQCKTVKCRETIRERARRCIRRRCSKSGMDSKVADCKSENCRKRARRRYMRCNRRWCDTGRLARRLARCRGDDVCTKRILDRREYCKKWKAAHNSTSSQASAEENAADSEEDLNMDDLESNATNATNANASSVTNATTTTTAQVTAAPIILNATVFDAHLAGLNSKFLACQTTVCRDEVREAIWRLFGHRANYLRRSFSVCMNETCRTETRDQQLSLYNQVKNHVEGFIAALQGRMRNCMTDHCRELIGKTLRREYRRLRLVLQHRLRDLRERLASCTTQLCRDRIARTKRAVTDALRTMYGRLERWLRVRIAKLRSSLRACNDHLCRHIVRRKLRDVFTIIRRHLHERIAFLRRRLSECSTDDCRGLVTLKLRKLEIHLRRGNACSRSRRAFLAIRLKSCKTTKCKRRLKRRLDRCSPTWRPQTTTTTVKSTVTPTTTTVDPAFAKWKHCPHSRRVVLRARLRLCSTRSCRRTVMSHLKKCGVYVFVPPTTRAPATEAPRRRRSRRSRRRIKRDQKEISDLKNKVRRWRRLMRRKERKARERRKRRRSRRSKRKRRKNKRTNKSCLSGLNTRKFRSARSHHRRKLGSCLRRSCKDKYRARLVALYRKRVKKLRRRLTNCGRRRHRVILRRWMRTLRSSITHYKNIGRRRELKRLRKKLLACGNKQACVKPLAERIKLLSRELDLVRREYLRLKRELSRCMVGLPGKRCRNRVMSRFRRVLHAKETALYREQRVIARARYSRSVLACERNQAGNPTAMARCVRFAKRKFSNRITELKMRQLQTDRRHAIRVCETSADPKSCIHLVNLEFKRDKKVAVEDATAAANALLSKMITPSN